MPKSIRSLALLAMTAGALPLHAQRLELDQSPSRFVQHDGVRIHYKSLGTGRTAVVFVHGWLGDISVWRSQATAANSRLRRIFIDLPGFGKSGTPDVEYSMDYLAESIRGVMDGAGVDRAVLVGHSMGTPVIRQFYRRYPDRTLGLVAVDGALRTFVSDTAAIRRFVDRFSGPAYTPAVEAMFDGMLATTEPAIRADVKRVALATSPRVAVSSMRGMLDLAIWKDDPIGVPVLAVMAPNASWSADYIAYVKKLAPGIRIETMDGVGHFLMLEKPREFNLLLTEFLDRVVPRR
jgi:pimeloyl-ACP methyl ester carboxylesterase